MSNIWFFVVPCLVLAYIGTKIRKPDSQVFEDWTFPWGPATPCRFPGKIMFLIGAIGAAIGIFAAFQGPVQLGSLTLPQSRFLTETVSSAKAKKSAMKEKYSRKEKVKKEKVWASATEYAKRNVTVTGGWKAKGKSTRIYSGTVHNRSDRKLRSVTFRLKGKSGDQNITVGNIDAFSTKDYSKNYGLTFWKDFINGPYIENASF